MNEFGFKELYDVSLKTTYPIEVGKHTIETGETVAVFDRIQIATIQEEKKFHKTGNPYGEIIWWEETKEAQITFSQGIFSKTQLALLTNAKLINKEGNSAVRLNCREVLETDETGLMRATHSVKEPLFVYDINTGEKITVQTFAGHHIDIGKKYKEYLVDYYYDYGNEYEILTVGNPLISGYLSLEGKTRVKDDTTGQVKTGIIKIPKLKLLSNLSMRLGNDAVPQVGRLNAVAVPTGERGQRKVMEIIFLDDDIDSDM